jgi:hypothetical protein
VAFVFAVLGCEVRASSMLGKRSTTKLHPQPALRVGDSLSCIWAHETAFLASSQVIPRLLMLLLKVPPVGSTDLDQVPATVPGTAFHHFLKVQID